MKRSNWKGEMATIIFGIQKFYSILSYHSFKINSDSSTLLQLKALYASTEMVFLQEELSDLDFTVCHRPDMQNTNANTLSCREDAAMPDPTA